ncbi:hypothetical protein GCM10009760_35720 [Kitasatospora kazusensis]|uniref:Uncharacterized protein n=1 Tax=Kitasatospora kazusensis TaxID=407974 RepID=A0ABN2ZR44_9ACTN
MIDQVSCAVPSPLNMAAMYAWIPLVSFFHWDPQKSRYTTGLCWIVPPLYCSRPAAEPARGAAFDPASDADADAG